MPVEKRSSGKEIVQGNRSRVLQDQSCFFLSRFTDKGKKTYVNKKQLNGVFYSERSHTSWPNGRIMTSDTRQTGGQPTGLLVLVVQPQHPKLSGSASSSEIRDHMFSQIVPRIKLDTIRESQCLVGTLTKTVSLPSFSSAFKNQSLGVLGMDQIKHVSGWNLEKGQRREQTYVATDQKWAGSPALRIQQALVGAGSYTK